MSEQWATMLMNALLLDVSLGSTATPVACRAAAFVEGLTVSEEPDRPRTIVFIDGQNFTHSLKSAFNMRRPSVNLPHLVQRVCDRQGWQVTQIRFYTGLPDKDISPDLHAYWMRRLSQFGRQGIWTWTRGNKYSMQTTRCTSCDYVQEKRVGREKGADVRIALDAVRLAYQEELDVALLFTQDQDFFELVQDLKGIARSTHREITVASAFPRGTGRSRGGIRGTLQIPLSRDDVGPA